MGGNVAEKWRKPSTFHQILLSSKLKEEMGEVHSTRGRKINCMYIFMGKQG
jgi:hypothetical protein